MPLSAALGIQGSLVKKFKAYLLIIFSSLLALFATLSALTSIPQFMKLDISQPYNWGYIGGRVIIIVLLLCLAKVLFSKGKKLKSTPESSA